MNADLVGAAPETAGTKSGISALLARIRQTVTPSITGAVAQQPNS